MAKYKSCRYEGKRMRYHRMLLRLLLKEKFGEPSDTVLKMYVIHHINGDGTDNRKKNIVVMTQKEHRRLHARRQKRGWHGRFV